jgi:hypothetical protein
MPSNLQLCLYAFLLGWFAIFLGFVHEIATGAKLPHASQTHLQQPQSETAQSLLPTQSHFLAHGVQTCTSLPDGHDVTCSICTEECEPESREASEETVKLTTCRACYFHRDCIISWFTSEHKRRGTCPNDRTELFEPDALLHPPEGY